MGVDDDDDDDDCCHMTRVMMMMMMMMMIVMMRRRSRSIKMAMTVQHLERNERLISGFGDLNLGRH